MYFGNDHTTGAAVGKQRTAMQDQQSEPWIWNCEPYDLSEDSFRPLLWHGHTSVCAEGAFSSRENRSSTYRDCNGLSPVPSARVAVDRCRLGCLALSPTEEGGWTLNGAQSMNSIKLGLINRPGTFIKPSTYRQLQMTQVQMVHLAAEHPSHCTLEIDMLPGTRVAWVCQSTSWKWPGR